MMVSDFTATLHLQHCEIRATCACGSPICGLVVKAGFDAKEARAFIVAAYKAHLRAEGAWEHPAGHALLIDVEPSVTVTA